MAWMVVLASAAGAVADEAVPIAQATAANATFLAFAPPPAGGAGAVCFVDSGANVNPDTDAALMHRESIDPTAGPDDGEVQLEDGSLAAHGTLMAMVAAAPRNSWGTVGIWPQARIVMVNGLPAGTHDFPVASFSKGIRRCLNLSSTYPIKVIELALGAAGSVPAGDEALIENAVQAAQQGGLDVVAAAGNDAGPVNSPASYPPVLAVAAGDPTTGALCAFSSRGPAVDVVAPGCGLDQADPASGVPTTGAGTSQASAIVATILAALRSYRPDLTPEAAEAILVSTMDEGQIDAAAAFQAAGLTDVVDQGRAAAALAMSQPSRGTAAPVAMRPSTAPVTTPPRRRTTTRHGRWPTPRVSIRRTSCSIVVRARNRPRAAAVRVELQEHWELGWLTRDQRVRAANAVRFSICPGRRGPSHARVKIVYEGGRTHRSSRSLVLRL